MLGLIALFVSPEIQNLLNGINTGLNFAVLRRRFFLRYNKMAVCGHQFRDRDATDWILSTSAYCLVGSTTANQILLDLFKRHGTDVRGKFIKKLQKPGRIKLQRDKMYNYVDVRDENEGLIVKKITGKHNFENFDESQHLNGCPMKWLYNKKLLQKNKVYKVDRTCYKNLKKKEELKIVKLESLRDKTPKEVKIHKINLAEKYTTNYEETYASCPSLFVKKTDNENRVEVETRRRKLAAKLNWKLHDEAPGDSSNPSSELKRNYLPPRPMLGLKPFLSLLLAPNQMTNCCSLSELARNSAKKEKVISSLSVQSLDLPDFPPRNSHPKGTNTSRWGSKSLRLATKLQLSNDVTINLNGNQKGGLKPGSELKIMNSNPTIKKLNDRLKETKSLSALFYELKDKSNFRNQPEECFANMIKDLTIEGQFKIKRFLNIGTGNFDLQVSNIPQLGREKQEVASAGLNLVCGKIRFFEKRPPSQKPKMA